MRGIILRVLIIIVLSFIFFIQLKENLKAQDIKILPTNAVSVLKLGWDVGQATSKAYFDSERRQQARTARDPSHGSNNGATNDNLTKSNEPVVSNTEAEVEAPECDNCASN